MRRSRTPSEQDIELYRAEQRLSKMKALREILVKSLLNLDNQLEVVKITPSDGEVKQAILNVMKELYKILPKNGG